MTASPDLDWLQEATQQLPIGPDLWCQGLHHELVHNTELVPSRFRMEHWMVPVRAQELSQLTLRPDDVTPDIQVPDSAYPGDWKLAAGTVASTSIHSVNWGDDCELYEKLLSAGHATCSFTIDHAQRRITRQWNTDHNSESVADFGDWTEFHIPVNSQFLDYYSTRPMISIFRYSVEHQNSKLYLTRAVRTPPRSGSVLLHNETRPLVAILSLTSGQVRYYYQE